MSKRTQSRQASTADVIIYARCSTQEQARSGLGIDAQVERCRAYCAFRGLTVVDVIIDAGVSGSTAFASRSGGARVVELLRSRQAGGVVAMKLDRMFRNAADCLALTQSWADDGAALHLLDLGIDTTSAMGRCFLTMTAAFAELERNMIAERTSGALQELKRKGHRLGAAPFGQEWSAQDGCGRRALSEAQVEADAVAIMLAMRQRGATLREIVAELDRAGVPTKRGGQWAAMTVKRILDRVDHDAAQAVEATA